jgi:3'-phosphoadenosine 5'-phosphosulfate sulfotransferase (PAPS reductase)/FAD synthetase
MIPSGIKDFETYIVGVSGGKDSTAAAIWALDNLPSEKVYLVHNPTGAAWPETMEYLRQLEQVLKPIEHVRSGDRPLPLRRDGRPRDDWYSAPTLFEMVRGRGRWPSFWQRYCTRYLKQVPIRQYAHEISDNPILILGSRADESKGREGLPQFDLNDSGYKDWVRYRTPVYYPILNWTELDVWEFLGSEDIEPNPIYEYVDRCGCWCCPLKCRVNDIRIFARLHPSLAGKAVAVERECGHTWKYKRSLEQLVQEATDERGIQEIQ